VQRLHPLHGLDDLGPRSVGLRLAVVHCPKSIDVARVVRGVSRVDQLTKPADVFALTGRCRRNRTMTTSHRYKATISNHRVTMKEEKPLPLIVGQDWFVEVKTSVKPLPQVVLLKMSCEPFARKLEQ
jgi:hypothetical protein